MLKFIIINLFITYGILISQSPKINWLYEDAKISGTAQFNNLVEIDGDYYFSESNQSELNLHSVDKSGNLNWKISLDNPFKSRRRFENIVKNGNNLKIITVYRMNFKGYRYVTTIDNNGEVLDEKLDSIIVYNDNVQDLPFYTENEVFYLKNSSNYDTLSVIKTDFDMNLTSKIDLDTAGIAMPVSYFLPRSFYINKNNHYMTVHSDTNASHFVFSEFSESGVLLQSFAYPQTKKNNGWNMRIIESNDGYYLANNAYNTSKDFYFTIIKIDKNFNEIWTREIALEDEIVVWGNTYNETDETFFVYGFENGVEVDENNINTKIVILEIDTDGEIVKDFRWKHYNPDVENNNYMVYKMIKNTEGKYVIYCTSLKGLFLAEIELVPTSVETNYTSESNFTIHPNPASDYIEISFGSHRDSKGGCPLVSNGEIEIYDVLGAVVWKSTSVASQTTHRVVSTQRIDISHLPKGMYFVRVGDRVEKFVKL